MSPDEKTRRVLDAAAARPRPESTYRLQFHAGFTFRDAAEIAPYLRDLGITHVYASPYLKARPGSTHGYDIVDHRQLNPEIGNREDFDVWIAALKATGLRQILDIVPNHMGVATDDNPWWNDVLENGPASRFAGYFDIAWNSSDRDDLRDRVLLPVLGVNYGETLESGRLRLQFENGTFRIEYFDRHFPVAPRSYSRILAPGMEELGDSLGGESTEFAEYQSIVRAVGHLPDRTETDSAKVNERSHEKEVIKRRLGELVSRSEPVRHFIEQTLVRINGVPGNPRSFDRIDDLLRHQCYRLAHWRVATDEINYRRFFDVNELAALSIEREDVFRAAHELIFELLANGAVDGVRIDHPDGLYDPREYLERLQKHYFLALARGIESEFNEAEWLERIDALQPENPHPLYVVVEKILGAKEPLPSDWPVDGTSGYEFMNVLNGLFVDADGEHALTRVYREFVEDYSNWGEAAYRAKRTILQASMASELHTVARRLERLAHQGRRSRDFTLNSLREALREVIANFPVYRTYIAESGAITAMRIAARLRRPFAAPPSAIRSPARRSSTSSAKCCCSIIPKPRPKRSGPSNAASSGNSNKSRVRFSRRDSRTRRSTGTSGSSHSMRSAATRRDSVFRRRPCIASMRSDGFSGRIRFRRSPRTTRSGAKMCGHGSICSRKFPRSGGVRCGCGRI